MMTFHPLHPNQVAYAGIAQETPNYPEDTRFLCRKGEYIFASYLKLNKTPDRTMPSNSKYGCFYVDGGHCGVPCIPIDELDEMFLILGT